MTRGIKFERGINAMQPKQRPTIAYIAGRIITGLDTLSMGMSDDLEAAIMEGATIVRVGSAIFGKREKTN